MYLNEKAWEIQQDNQYIIDEALKNFLKMYSVLAGKFHQPGIFVPADMEIYLRSKEYPIGKWLSEVDIEYRRLFLSFLEKRVIYQPDEEYEVSVDNERLNGATEAFLNDSFLISLCLNDIWKIESLKADFFSLNDLDTRVVYINNVYDREQLQRSPIQDILAITVKEGIYSYQELWKRREELFPHLRFCPSVKRNLEELEISYISQVIKKLSVLEQYCSVNGEGRFKPELLTKATPEGDPTLKKYKKQHTFFDDEQQKYTAEWHTRFTGIEGRIFFVPKYKGNLILICYIEKKLPNVTYPT